MLKDQSVLPVDRTDSERPMMRCKFIDLSGRKDHDAEAILEWSDAFVGSLRQRLLGIHSGRDLPASDLAELKACSLLDEATSRPTALDDYLILYPARS